ncbi:MAG: universal stress protein [Polyangiaceae bacterium]|nr:universal stress protein [Polyangiaceae bacterium]
MVQHVGTPERPNGWPAGQPAGRRRVLVSLRATEAPSAAINVGRVVARTLAAPLHGVLIWPTQITPSDVPRLLRIDPEALEGMVLDVDVGDPAERLDAIARSSSVAFVVLAAEELGADACGVGDTALRALARMSASIIIVRPRAALSQIRHILVPLDGTPSTAAALEPASELAERAGAALDLVLVADVTAAPPTEPGTMTAPQYVDQPQHEWPAFSAEFIQRFVGSVGHRLPGVPVRFFLGSGRPAAEILRYAGELGPDLIALVWRDEGAAEPGPVLREVMRSARQPILVVRR